MAAANGMKIMVNLPDWVPVAVLHYLVHTETGVSIRALARAQNVHASTILRQVRRFENRRDDPLVDDALRGLTKHITPTAPLAGTDMARTDIDLRVRSDAATPGGLTESQIDCDATRVLRRLCETGAVLASARDMDLAVVVRDMGDGNSTRTASVTREVAQVMALRDWIACATPASRIARYHITSAGRAALKHLLASSENRALGLGDAGPDSADQHRDWGYKDIEDGGDARPHRYNLAESPLSGLARRRDRDGTPFLSRDLVAAGERLREDFELAQMGPKVTQNWDSFLTGPIKGQGASKSEGGSAAAQGRVMAALHDLGPGLGDVVLRCCCFLEGLEIAEKRLGWAARSGKIVLRIALLRLKQHYEATGGKFGPKIG